MGGGKRGNFQNRATALPREMNQSWPAPSWKKASADFFEKMNCCWTRMADLWWEGSFPSEILGQKKNPKDSA